MVIDSALAEDPELVRAAASATILAVENGNLEGELRDWRARIVAAGDAARRRIERDLHDGAQQRLVALRIQSRDGERDARRIRAAERLNEEEGRVRFLIEDDGVGFDPLSVDRGAGPDHSADRVAAAGGGQRIESTRGHGTRVSGLLPA